MKNLAFFFLVSAALPAFADSYPRFVSGVCAGHQVQASGNALYVDGQPMRAAHAPRLTPNFVNHLNDHFYAAADGTMYVTFGYLGAFVIYYQFWHFSGTSLLEEGICSPGVAL